MEDWIMSNKIRRWILFLPLAFIASILAGWIFYSINIMTMGRYIKIDSLFFQVYDIFFSNFIRGFVFSFVGIYIAPFKKVNVFFIFLTTLICTGFIYMTFYFYPLANWWFLLIGSFSFGLGSFYVIKKSSNNENNR